jgi:hypothetical protein
MSRTATRRWREIFAEAQVPYAKIMGCAHFGTMRATATTATKPEPEPKIAPETYKLNHNYEKIIS